jgi:hypothetical protein
MSLEPETELRGEPKLVTWNTRTQYSELLIVKNRWYIWLPLTCIKGHFRSLRLIFRQYWYYVMLMAATSASMEVVCGNLGTSMGREESAVWPDLRFLPRRRCEEMKKTQS